MADGHVPVPMWWIVERFFLARASFIHAGVSGSVSLFSFSTSPIGGREVRFSLDSASQGGVMLDWLSSLGFSAVCGGGGLERSYNTDTDGLHYS